MADNLVICADDYALSPATSAIIRDLLARGDLNATTCLVETADWEREGVRLRALADAQPGVAVGLHLNLTERFVQCAAPDAVKPVSWWLTHGSASTRVTARALNSWRTQWAMFVERFGRAPDFLDGHQHVHLYPPARRALLALIQEKAFRGWVRQCRTSGRRFDSQRLLYDPLSARLIGELKGAGHLFNPGFGGLRWFRRSEPLERLWHADLSALTTGGLLIVHPGGLGSPPGSDGIDRCRVEEAAAFTGGRVRALLETLGLTLAKTARTPPWARP